MNVTWERFGRSPQDEHVRGEGKTRMEPVEDMGACLTTCLLAPTREFARHDRGMKGPARPIPAERGGCGT